jgi:hypothetical protein
VRWPRPTKHPVSRNGTGGENCHLFCGRCIVERHYRNSQRIDACHANGALCQSEVELAFVKDQRLEIINASLGER